MQRCFRIAYPMHGFYTAFMTDHLTPEKRSWNMGRIKAKNTKPELLLRSALHRAGYRFRIHVKTLPGTPDIVLPKYRTVIFVHGCFWHRHPNCKKATMPKTRTVFWQTKFDRNIANDKRHKKELNALEWKVITVWECELKDVDQAVEQIQKQLHEEYVLPSKDTLPMAAEKRGKYGGTVRTKEPNQEQPAVMK